MMAGLKDIAVLDHGYVKFIGSLGTDESVVEAARMSTGKGFERWEAGDFCATCGMTRELADAVREQLNATNSCNGNLHQWKTVNGDAKLLEYLYKNQHMSPFEMCQGVFEVQAPLMVFREWHRHRTGAYNEFSARYAQMPNLHYLPELSRFQKQSTANKQGSAEPLAKEVAEELRFRLEGEQADIFSTYEYALQEKVGLAKEVARLNTPVSRYSKMRVSMSLRNWFQFLNLRMRPNAQWEIRQYANAVASMISQLWPRSYALFLEHDLNGVRFSAAEVVELKETLLQAERLSRSITVREQHAAIFKKLESL